MLFEICSFHMQNEIVLSFLPNADIRAVFTMPYFLIHLYVTFEDAPNAVNYIELFNQKLQAIFQDIKSDLSPKCQVITFKGLTKIILDVGLDH